MSKNKIEAAIKIIEFLGLPKAQQNERSALCLLALINLSPDKKWSKAENPLIGITPIMDWVRDKYKKDYAPNTRETFRRQTMHQFVDAGIALYNPDNPKRPVNSPKAVYQIETATLNLIRLYGTKSWKEELSNYLLSRKTLVEKYKKARNRNLVSVKIPGGLKINLTPGEHSVLIKEIIESFAPGFVPGADLIYAGDTGSKWGFFNVNLLKQIGVVVDSHGKMPDVVLYFKKQKWLVLVEAVTSHGPVDSKRHSELSKLFEKSKAGLVYVTAFPDKSVMAKYLSEIAWETEVWVAEDPSHLIHFNGERFLGPY